MAYLKPDSPIPTEGKGRKLGPKMELFVQHYIIEMNATQAVLKAGYKTRNPQKMATELMRHPLVKEKIKEAMDERRERMELSADYVITKLMDIVEETEKGNPGAALRGLELLGKHLGLYRDKQEISGPDGGAIEVENKKIEQDAADFTRRISRLAQRNGTNGVSEFPKPGSSGEA